MADDYVTVGWTTSPMQIAILNISVQASCFLEGTKILTESGEYILIEECVPGTFIKTVDGLNIPVKHLYHAQIFHQHFDHLNNLYIYRQKRYDGAIDDLIVTGGHPLLSKNISPFETDLNKKYYNQLTYTDDYIRVLSIISEESEVCTELPQGIYDVYDIIFEGEAQGIYANGFLTKSMSESHFLKATNHNTIH